MVSCSTALKPTVNDEAPCIRPQRLHRLLNEVPRDYRRAPVTAGDLALLRASDGIQIDNDFVSSAQDCRWENETLHRDARYRRRVYMVRAESP